MAEVITVDGNKHSFGRVNIKDSGWVVGLRHRKQEDGTWEEQQTHIPQDRVASVTANRIEPHKGRVRYTD